MCRRGGTHGVSAPTARKWLGRYLADGESGLADASSRPALSPESIEPAKALAIVELRRRRLTASPDRHRAWACPKSTVGRVLARAGLSKLSDLEPASRSCATSTSARATCCTSTPRSSAASSARATGSPATARDASTAPAGSCCSWPSTTMPASASPTCTPTRRHSAVAVPAQRRRLLQQPGRHGQAAADRQRLGLPLHALRQGLPRARASATSSPAPTGRRPTARPSASSSRRCANGPTASPTSTRRSAPKPWTLDASLQLASPPPRHRRHRTHVSDS